MTVASLPIAPPRQWTTPLFASAMFASAALVFMVEPLIAKMILPQLGGSPAVWNTCMAFFQLALLAGYLYAHLLQRVRSIGLQVVVHLVLLAAAAIALPLGVTGTFGPPPVGAPVMWLLRVLFVSIGAPFAVLSATAPLLQCWYARAEDRYPQTSSPYVFYGASNLGSMLALLAYPTLIEPSLAVHTQTFGWAIAYAVFGVLMTCVGGIALRGHALRPGSALNVKLSKTARPTLRDRILWLALAAAPSSLMLGVTTYISNDVASVPLFWVIPLALYLLTFIISFQAQPLISRERALLWQAVFVAMAAGLLCVNTTSVVAHLFTYLGAFFFCALVCHQSLSASRPHTDHLTEFYLLLSLGGVVGGMFNAFVAPVIFSRVVEFPLVLALCVLARPWRMSEISRRDIALAAAGILVAIVLVFAPASPRLIYIPVVLAIAGASIAGLVSRQALLFALVAGALCTEATFVPPDGHAVLLTVRSFFGVHRVTAGFEPALGGELHLLFHGTTIHGAQPQAGPDRCRTTTYYARSTPIGQAFTNVLSRRPNANIGVVGLGTGSVAAYTRAGDRMRFFEIDPEVARIARDKRYFTYLSDCAKGVVDIVLGDARLTLAQEKPSTFDLLQLDAFSADNVPTHLLTIEAFKLYLRAIKPDGVILLHLTNRNLALEAPVAAAVRDVGAVALMQDFNPPRDAPAIAAAPTKVMLVAKSRAALAAFVNDSRWRAARDNGVRAWSDDYTNVIGAMIAQAASR
jgi:SAM-dependent methyltransferase